jgi:hypothetical protein
LNTELENFCFDDLYIIPIRNQLVGKPWGACLKYALDKISEDYILYLQDDYFFRSSVNAVLIQEFFQKFIENDMDCLHLTDQCTDGPFKKNTVIEDVWEIEKGAEYRVSTQAAFWKKSSLIKLLRYWESGWQFEYFGTKRSDYLLNNIMCVSQELMRINDNEVLPYVFTGIIKGKWNPAVKKLFQDNNIPIDLNLRGLYNFKETNKLPLSRRVKKIMTNKKSVIDLFFIKMK